MFTRDNQFNQYQYTDLLNTWQMFLNLSKISWICVLKILLQRLRTANHAVPKWTLSASRTSLVWDWACRVMNSTKSITKTINLRCHKTYDKFYLAGGYRVVHDVYTGTTTPVRRLGVQRRLVAPRGPLAVLRTPILREGQCANLLNCSGIEWWDHRGPAELDSVCATPDIAGLILIE